MPEEPRHESQDLQDYETQDPLDSLDGNPDDDPLDRGVAPPQRWSAGMRYGTTADEQQEGESLDQHLAEEVPDTDADEAGEETDPRAGRLVAEDEGSHPARESDLVARDAGVDGGAASAEEAGMHVVDGDDTDVRSEQ